MATPSRRDQLTEAQWLKQVRQLAELLGWTFYHPWLSRFSPRGFPDIVLCRPPRLLFAELKTDTGRLTPDQERWIELLRACRQEVYVWRPSDWDEMVAVLHRTQKAGED